MKRKLRLAVACLAFTVLAYFALTRGVRRMPRAEPERRTMTVVVDMPKTNAGAPAPVR